MADLILGREELVADLLAARAVLDDGFAAVRVLSGDAGIGKTTVLHVLAGRLEDVVVRVSGFGGLHAPRFAVVNDLMDGLGAVQVRADEDVDVLTVGHRVLASLRARAAHSPVVLFIDDAHEIEPTSRTALSMALGWLRSERVFVVVATLPRVVGFTASDGFVVRQVQPLSLEVCGKLIADSCPLALAPAVRDQLSVLAGGNPLAATRLARSLPAEVLSGERPLPDVVPLDGCLTSMFARPLSRLCPTAARLLDLVAVSGSSAWEPVSQVLGAGSDEALQAVEAAGLLTLERGSVLLPHPLLRSAVLARMSAEAVRTSHAELSEATALPDHARLIHRAKACVGADPALSDELQRRAEVAVGDGDHEVAGRLLELSADLADDPGVRDERRLAAAVALADGGVVAVAREHLMALTQTAVAHVRVEASRRCAILDALHGDPIGAWQSLQVVANMPGDAMQRARVHATMALPLGMLGMSRAIVEEAARAVDLSASNSPTSLTARATLAHGSLAIEEGVNSILLADPSGGRLWSELVVEDPAFGLHIGRALSLAERFDDAERVLTALRAIGSGRPSLALTLGSLGELQFRTCRWGEADRTLSDAIGLSLAMGQQAFATFWLAIRGRIRGLRGDLKSAQKDLGLGMTIATDQGLLGAQYFLQASAGLVHRVAGDPAAAIECLEQCLMFEEVGGSLSPNLGRWRGELVELYLETGRRDEALALADHLDVTAAMAGAGDWTRGASARTRAQLVEDPAEAFALLSVAIARFDARRDAFDHGRALRLRAGLAVTAGASETESDAHAVTVRTDAARAAFLFGQLGAAGWVNAEAAEVRDMRLSAIERRVMAGVGQGSSNRQIAAQLDLSPKTVANHLYRIYRRLGVSSRIEALSALDDGAAAEP